jgi:2-amino-4-hydroxy-6-hydroxymethyldihydropteridine diphosphokinase
VDNIEFESEQAPSNKVSPDVPEDTGTHTSGNRGIFIGIGSNIGDTVQHCAESIERILEDERVKLLAVSSFYSTSPVSPVPQDDFINCAIAIEWGSSPADLLLFLNGIEEDMGRIRLVASGPRIIDLDILLYGDIVLSTPRLTIPHPELHRRKFALVPCLEINRSLIHPVHKVPLVSFLEEMDETQKISLYLPSSDLGGLTGKRKDARRAG